MKKFTDIVRLALSAGLVSLWLATPTALALPSADQMKANYDACLAGDESWHRRWGQYVVAFDLNTATEICHEPYWVPYEARLTGCKLNGGWAYAGYYCQELYFP